MEMTRHGQAWKSPAEASRSEKPEPPDFSTLPTRLEIAPKTDSLISTATAALRDTNSVGDRQNADWLRLSPLPCEVKRKNRRRAG